MPKSFDIYAGRGITPHVFNTAYNLDYVGPYPVPKCYGVDYISGHEQAQFLEWYDEQKDKIFCNNEELLICCMGYVNVLRHACCAFRKFLKIVQDGILSSSCHNIVHVQ